MKRKIACAVVVTAFLSLSAIVTPISAAIKYGDVNGDDTVDSGDFTLLRSYLLTKIKTLPNISAADTSGDGSVDSADYLLLRKYLLRIITTLPAELITPTVALSPTGVSSTSWDWNGVIGTGQSLAVGEQGKPARTTTQPYNNLQLSTGSAMYPIDPTNNQLKMIPLVEPIGRLAPNYPSSYPENIAGETPHSTMANQITALSKSALGRDYISVHSEVGENGQALARLIKGAVQDGSVTGRSFNAALFEASAITRLAKAAGKTYGVGAVIITHGEGDSGSTTYANDLYKLWSDYNTDISAITGQTKKLQMIVSQQNSVPNGFGNWSSSTLEQWRVGVQHPQEIVCSGPKYQYQYAADNVHLVAEGYQMLGEKYGQVYYERVVLGNNWQPLQPTSVERSGRDIIVKFHVPVGPLVWDNTMPAPHHSEGTEWKNGKGFEVRTDNNTRITISSVTIEGDSVRISCASDLPENYLKVAYATNGETARTTPSTGTWHWGLLRDSDPFVGSTTQKVQPNYCVAFELAVP